MLSDLSPNTDRGNVVLAGPDAPARDDVERIVQSRHDAPHRILGPHFAADRSSVAVRALFPHAQQVSLRVVRPAAAYEMRRIHDDGLFEAVVAAPGSDFDYEFIVTDSAAAKSRLRDAYAYSTPWFTEEDEALFSRGAHCRLYQKLGAHPLRRGAVEGIGFAVWAPHASRVSVVGTFNRWDGRCHQMRRLNSAGIWDLFIPDAKPGDFYKFEIKTAEGTVFLKGDPWAFRTEAHPHNASIIDDGDWSYWWLDAEWRLAEHARRRSRRGAAVYRLDLDARLQAGAAGGDQRRLIELATDKSLAPIVEQGYTHVELASALPGHFGSASAFAPGEAYGNSDDLMELVDACHQHALGFIVPVLGARLTPGYADLAWFDGTRLYETEPAGEAELGLLATGKGEVRSFLLSNAAFWVERYHVDGWRTDRRGARLYRQLELLEGERYGGALIVVRESAAPQPLAKGEAERLLRARHDNPHAILGPHYDEQADELTLRVLRPHAEQVYAAFADEPAVVVELPRVHAEGLFATVLPEAPAGVAYRLRFLEGGKLSADLADVYAYNRFAFSDADQQLFGSGSHYRINEKLGAHPRLEDGVAGVGFAVWAPNAEGVSVVGPWNGWNGRCHQMKRHGHSGVWEVFVPDLRQGELYKFEIHARHGHTYLKSDPYAFYAETPPATASVVYGIEGAHTWRDQDWMERRRQGQMWEQPVAIYEVHLGSWMRGPQNEPLSYLELADRLVPYVKEMGFTHLELLPVAEHPYEPSWGYQVTGYFAPTSRYGRPEQLMEFVDRCHQHGIGVLLDWVSGHFPKDAHGLAWFDGTCLYEHADPRKGEHRDWGTLVFNYGRHEVDNFLVANARFWLEHYHFDGLRVDAVASMLYLDYSRPKPGDWIPNKYGGRENLEAIEFLKHTNIVVHREFPGAMMIAEESTAWPNVSRPVDKGGLGFGYKWNMGWMHDVLAYMGTPPEQRRHHHNKITFGLVYAFAENYVLSLSHDEVVHMKRSLLNKMPGGEADKFANLRLLYAFMYGHPGKKLLFMGAEFGQESEWNHARGLEWHLLEREPHRRLHTFMQELNRLYRAERAFFEADFKGVGFEWLEVDNAEESIVAFLRKAKDPRNALLFVFNFSAVSRPHHRVPVPYPGAYTRIFTTNAKRYGGNDAATSAVTVRADELAWHGREFSIDIVLPALSAVIFKPAPADTASIAA